MEIPLMDCTRFGPQIDPKDISRCGWCGKARAECAPEPITPEEPAPAPEPDPEPVTAEEEVPGDFDYPDLQARWKATLEKTMNRAPFEHGIWASQIGDPCERRIYLGCTGAESRPIDEGLASIFVTGDDLEQVAMQRYQRIGFTVERSQERFEAKDEEGRTLWSGKGDGLLRDMVSGKRFVAETKWYAYPDSIRPDLKAKARGQVVCYLSPDGYNQPRGYLAIWSKADGMPYPERVEFDPDEYAQLIDKARRINQAIEAKEPPEGVNDIGTCLRCQHYNVSCFPRVQISPVGIIQDEGISADLAYLADNQDEAAQEAKVRKRVRESFRGNEPGEYTTKDGVMVTLKKTAAGALTMKVKRHNREDD